MILRKRENAFIKTLELWMDMNMMAEYCWSIKSDKTDAINEKITPMYNFMEKPKEYNSEQT